MTVSFPPQTKLQSLKRKRKDEEKEFPTICVHSMLGSGAAPDMDNQVPYLGSLWSEHPPEARIFLDICPRPEYPHES